MLLNVKELQSRLRIGRDKSYALMRSKGFPSIKIGSRYYVEEDALLAWLTKYRYREYII